MEAYFAGKIIKLNGGFTCYPCHDIQAKEQISSQVSPGVSGLTTKHQSRLCLFFFYVDLQVMGRPKKKSRKSIDVDPPKSTGAGPRTTRSSWRTDEKTGDLGAAPCAKLPWVFAGRQHMCHE